MIQLEEIEINDFRGIRKATIALNRKSMVVTGPNGTGKSGVVDAIQFALTGSIARLTGEGTKEFSLAAHGPHITTVTEPEKSWVRLKVFLPSLQRSATITRSVKRASQPKIEPHEPDILAIFNFLKEHDEFSLSRREIIKFVLSENGKRSTDVQTLLRLQVIEQTRAVLGTARNRVDRIEQQAHSVLVASASQVSSHLGVDVSDVDAMLAAINEPRARLGLVALVNWDVGVSVTTGLTDLAKTETHRVGKDVALAYARCIREGPGVSGGSATSNLLVDLARLVDDPSLLASLHRLELFELGATLLDSGECPLCETEWDAEKLRSQLSQRIADSLSARELRDRLLLNGRIVADQANAYGKQVEQLGHLPETTADVATLLHAWAGELVVFARSMSSLAGIQGQTVRLETGWLDASPERDAALAALAERVVRRPEQSDAATSRDVLVVAEKLLDDFHQSEKRHRSAIASASRAQVAYSHFVEVAEHELAQLYSDVENDFCAYYRLLNSDDEGEFVAELTPEDSGLGFAVDFFHRGLFPPGALHSEGHQDGMGVCLYLALIKRAFGSNLTCIVLDDVVMSVDATHRRRFCDLLQKEFSAVQFVITTHDDVWARQLRTAGVVDAAGVLTFHSWDVEHGPLLELGAEVWVRIEEDLKRNDVPSAAAKLRRHLEFVMGELADGIAASIQYRADAAYDLGDKLNAVLSRQRALLKSALKAAKSWGQQQAIERVEAVQTAFDAAVSQRQGEQWLINKAVHYNEWAGLVREDFTPVLEAFQHLLRIWQCTVCGTSLELTSRINPKSMRCRCGAVDFNLVPK